jgi:YD repeat-containing protein
VGNVYKFGSDEQSRAVYPWFDFNCSHPHEAHTETWRWALKEITNPAGQKLTFSYVKDTKSTTHPCSPYEPYDTTLALYPSQIDYPNGKYRVVFNLESRSDYRKEWTNASSRTFFQQRRLNSVSVVHVPTGAVMRKYQFSYAVVYPGWVWDKGWQSFSLSSIQELGLNGAGGRPATTFAYADGMHLSQADNGYGGKVSFNYDATPWNAYVPAYGYQYAYDGTCPNGWTADTGSSACSSSSHLDITGSVHHDFGKTSVQPGVRYRVSLHAKNLSLQDSKAIELWLQSDATTVTVVQTATLTGGQEITLGGVGHEITLPKNANLLRLKVACGDCRIFINDTRVDALLTRYRVTSRVVQEAVTSKSYTYTYRYDEPAVNDSDHSAAASDPNPYQSPYSEFRGHVMAEEKGPDGRVAVTYYRQGDALKGNPNLTLVGTRSFEDAFDSINTSNWTKTSQFTGLYMGDRVLVNYNQNANWNENIYRAAYELADASGKPNTALVQFRVSGAGSQAVLALENLDGGVTRRWGVWLLDESGAFEAKVQYNSGGGWVYPTSFTVSHDRWYVLQLSVDNDSFLLRLWERDNPVTVNEYKLAMPTGLTWRFRNWAWSGTVFLDDYSEGRLYQVSEYVYPSDPSAPIQPNDTSLPHDPSGQPYDELKLYWARQTEVRSLTYEGDGDYRKTRTEYQYNPADQNGSIQYGNLTRQLESSWSGGAWSYYRAQFSRFYPNVTSSVYIVGLPATDNHFKCSSGSCDFAAGNMIAGKIFLYDGSSAFTTPPVKGQLTGERVLLRFAGANYTDPRYSDTQYVYDAWGNRIQTTRYTGEGNGTALASSGAQNSYACYGVANTPSGCSDNGYYSFVVWENNDVITQKTTYTYDYTLALPLTQVDPNNATTTLTYDAFGRLATVVRQGDSASYPTLQVVYYDNWQPFMIDVHQRITAGAAATYSQRRFYDGLGNLIQVQTPGAQLADNACSADSDTNPDRCDLVSDSEFDANGQVIKQTVPYPITAWYTGLTPTPYHEQELNKPATTTGYDILGRPLAVHATDNATATYQYNRLSTLVTDAKGHVTTNTLDEWGRTTQVTPPAGPAVSYEYDVADRLTKATRSGFASQTIYDLAGRILQTIDPDLGTWNYTYDALHLTRQTDARGQRLCFYYDALNRLTGKHYRGDDSCPSSYTTPGVSYAYDAGTNGIGQRTSMSDASGSASWTYDARGRMTQESKTVTGAGTFVTQWHYNSAGDVTWMKYPGGNASQVGEQVSFSYLPQDLASSVAGTNTYLKSATYDAAGRPTLLGLGLSGSSPLLQTSYTYYAWTSQGGRLQFLKSGTPGSPTSLQSFEYNYDAVGNLNWIKDYNAGGTQTHSFGYDAADRLTSAAASDGTNGIYSEAYTYDGTTGNLSSKTGLGTYTYNSTHKHAVASVSGRTFQYDACLPQASPET